MIKVAHTLNDWKELTYHEALGVIPGEAEHHLSEVVRPNRNEVDVLLRCDALGSKECPRDLQHASNRVVQLESLPSRNHYSE